MMLLAAVAGAAVGMVVGFGLAILVANVIFELPGPA
jgi:hypothetical protein